MSSHDPRPFFLNPLKIHLPLTGIVSIAHRIAGLVLFICLPYAIYLLDRSLADPAGYEFVANWLNGIPLRVAAVLLLTLFVHHLAAGLRILLMDIEVGGKLPAARRSAGLVLLVALVASLLAGLWL